MLRFGALCAHSKDFFLEIPRLWENLRVAPERPRLRFSIPALCWGLGRCARILGFFLEFLNIQGKSGAIRAFLRKSGAIRAFLRTSGVIRAFRVKSGAIRAFPVNLCGRVSC